MGTRYTNSDGHTVVDVIDLSLTGTGRDGTWFRVKQYGFFAGEVRTRAELVKLIGHAAVNELHMR